MKEPMTPLVPKPVEPEPEPRFPPILIRHNLLEWFKKQEREYHREIDPEGHLLYVEGTFDLDSLAAMLSELMNGPPAESAE